MATVQVQITNTADDVQEAVGVALDTSAIVAGYNASFGVPFAGGIRFRSVTGPVSGATVNSATLTLMISIGGTPNTTIYGVDVDDVAVWSDPGNLPSAAARTTASVAGPTATGSQQINVATIVQEILNRAGWASGNDMAFVGIDNAGAGNNSWQADDIDDAGTDHAVLDIDYTNPGGATLRRYSLTLGGVG